MKNLFVFVLALCSQSLFAQILNAPADIVITCQMSRDIDLELDSLSKIDHAFLGKMRQDSQSRQSLTTTDLVCPKLCDNINAIGYNPSQEVHSTACSVYSANSNLPPDSMIAINWGKDGWYEQVTDLSVQVVSLKDVKTCGANHIMRIFSAQSGNGTLRDTQHIFRIQCYGFSINEDDRFDPNDCVIADNLPEEAFVFSESMDSMSNPRHFPILLPDTCLASCRLIVIDYLDQVVFHDMNNYFKLRRLWTIIDWCEYDPSNPMTGGRWSYDQCIHVFTTPGNLQGRIAIDENNNCLTETQETGLGQWLVTATNPQDTIQTVSNFDGTYSLPLPFGEYQITAHPINTAWDVCFNDISVQLDSANRLDTIDFSIEEKDACRDPRIYFQTNKVVHCQPTRFSLELYNAGSVQIMNGNVDLTFSGPVQINQSTLPLLQLNDREYQLTVDSLNPGEYQRHHLDLLADCDSLPQGSILCVDAALSPSDSCELDGFDGPIIDVESDCDGDSAVFTLYNVGSDMSAPEPFWVIEDDLILFMDWVDLDGGDSLKVKVEFKGEVYHLVCEQVDDFPNSGQVVASLFGCSGQRVFSTPTTINHYTSQGTYLNTTQSCHVVDTSTINTFKSAVPLGQGVDHVVRKTQRITYKLGFANEGMDTIRTLEIQDFLDQKFDLSTFQMEGSSHPVKIEIAQSNPGLRYGVSFEFDSIDLPPIAVDPLGGKGYVSFSVVPEAGIMNGDRLINRASAFIDGLASKPFNQVFHTIGEPVVTVQQDLKGGTQSLSVVPNPATDQVSIQIPARFESMQGTLSLWTVDGVEVFQSIIEQLPANWTLTPSFSSGLYIVKLNVSNGQTLSTLMVKM